MNARVAQSVLPYNLIITTLGLVIIGLVVAYMYFLSLSVVHVVLRKEVHQAIAKTESEIAALESSFILAQHAVSDKIAAMTNFTETEEKIFVSRATPTLVLKTTD